jgi:hypothetical protein
MSWLLWLIGVALAVIVGLHVLGGYDVPVVIDQIKGHFEPDGMAKTLLVGMGLVAISKFF